MKLLVDERWFGNTGIGRYAFEILDRKPDGTQISHLRKNWKIKNPASPWLLGREINSRKADIFWSPGFMPPAHSKIPYAVTVHDLIHLHYGSFLQRIYYNEILLRLLRRAAVIFTDSEYSRNEILTWSRFPPELVRVIPLAASSSFCEMGDVHRPNYPYILYVGNRRVYKNIERLIKAFAIACKDTDIRLVLSGIADPNLIELARRVGLGERLVFLGAIKDDDLPSIYRGALAVAYVSLYEGFGLPPLEAMACGTPVITSNVTSIPEVVGDQGLMVDPHDVDAIADGLLRLVDDPSLRAKLRLNGLERAKQFSWEKTAELTWRVLEEAAVQ